ncbi:MAG: HAMP domain-containing sensor histidine kinase [Gemmatimonadaceae bacterium]
MPAGRRLNVCLLEFPGAVVELTRDGVVTDSNGRLEQLLGHDLVGRNFAEVLDVTSQRKWAHLLAREPAAHASLWEFNLQSRDGLELRTFAAVWAPEEPSESVWLLEYGRDLRLEPLYEELAAANSELFRTQRTLAKESARLAQALRVQEAAVHLRDDVLAIVAHDLRNPLDRISAGVALLLDETLAAESRPRVLAAVERTVTDMNRLVRDLLDAASIDSGRLALDRRRVDVSQVIESACETFLAQATAKKLRLDWHVGGAFVVYADRGRVMQLLGNLLSNAIRLTPSGGRLEVRAELAGDLIRFSVSDTGPGISPPDVPFLFERFWQGAREGRGSAGLGLAIARGIVEGHGGNIWVESEVGRGTTFFFTLPTDGGPPPSLGARQRQGETAADP